MENRKKWEAQEQGWRDGDKKKKGKKSRRGAPNGTRERRKERGREDEQNKKGETWLSKER
jgi:hypothetical protein